jgi:hypothetical protein
MAQGPAQCLNKKRTLFVIVPSSFHLLKLGGAGCLFLIDF